MKRIVLFVIILCMSFVLPTTIYAEESNIDTIKIGLFYGSTAKDSITVSSSDGFLMGTETDGEFKEDLLISQKEITVSAGDGNSVIIGEHIYDAAEFPTLYAKEGNIFVDSTQYRGGVQFKRLNGGLLTVINIVGIEPYLYSVIGKEMSPSWNIEALKAQAVCARGFAISNYNKFEKYGFNLDTTTTSQVYKGVSTETESTRRAADETKGMVLKHDGKIIESIYCASMGGASANAENVWGGKYPYLVSVRDIYENPDEATRYSWSVTLSAEEIEKCLLNSGINIGKITDVKIQEQDDAGYVTELTFYGTDGSHTVKKSSCRTIFGGKLHSQRYSMEGNEEIVEKLTINADSFSIKPTILPAVYWGMEGILDAFSKGISVESSSVKTSPKDGFTFNGNGWGHGVGMSQWGAKAMADQGYTYEEILTFYYTGTYLENIY